MTIRFEIPREIEQQLHLAGVDPNREAQELFFVGLYRQGKITPAQFSSMLGLDRFEADEVLKRHGVEYGPTLDDFRREVESLREIDSR